MKVMTLVSGLLGAILISTTALAGINFKNTCVEDNSCMTVNLDEFQASQPLLNEDPYFLNTSVYSKPERRVLHRLPGRIITPGEKVFVFSPKLRAWAAYDTDGKRIASGIANGGASYCSDIGSPCFTPKGKYRIQRKGDVSCVSRAFDDAPMPYCMFFKGGYAIHGSPYISNYNGSHGCIRVTTEAARWLHQNFIDIGTRIVVLSY